MTSAPQDKPNQLLKASNPNSVFEIFLHIVLAGLIYLSWVWPRTANAAALAVAAALFLAFLTTRNSKLSYKLSYTVGIIVNIVGFYWLEGTIQHFGGFSPLLSWPIFAFFVFVSSFQFLLFAFLFNRLPSALGFIKLPLAWVSAEFICPRIFPWELGTPLLGIPILTQVADIAGSPFVTFILLTAASLFVGILYCASNKSKIIYCSLLAAILIFWCLYGKSKLREFDSAVARSLKLAVVQANVEVVQQGDMAVIQQNKRRYFEISKTLKPEIDLIVWPEAVLQDWISIGTSNIAVDPRIPFFGPNSSLLTGALTFESQERFFNSALLVNKDGNIQTPYHKRILMPYGEYMPFSSVFPWMNDINANLALFTAGIAPSIFEVATNNSSQSTVKISPLICYEDLIPRLARSATQQGAEALFNLTNDAWFGDGPAAVHHSLIASFRAIENRRYLVRSTNTGLTEIINSVGNSVGQISPRSEGILEAEIMALTDKTLFTEFLGPWLWWLIGGISFLVAVWPRASRVRST